MRSHRHIVRELPVSFKHFATTLEKAIEGEIDRPCLLGAMLIAATMYGDVIYTGNYCDYDTLFEVVEEVIFGDIDEEERAFSSDHFDQRTNLYSEKWINCCNLGIRCLMDLSQEIKRSMPSDITQFMCVNILDNTMYTATIRF